MMGKENSLDVSYEQKEPKKFQLTRGMLILGIAILLLIVVIIIIIMNIISKKEQEITSEDYIKLESRMEEEAMIYIMQSQIVLDSNDIKIELKDLLLENGGSIDSSKVKAASVCEGYVIASKKEYEQYDAYIKCSDKYTTNGYISGEGEKPEVQKSDNIKPVITLKGNSKIIITEGEVYNEPGYEAIDETDGNITSSVILTGIVNTKQAGLYSINYEVKDKAGNVSSVKREIEVKQKEVNPVTTTKVTTTKRVVTTKRTTTTKRVTTTRKTTTTMLSNPYITLKGSSTITMNVGTSYNEPGYIAYDSAGKVITSKVNVSSNVNVKVAGTYYVTYKVTDSYGKSTTKTRTVVVKQSNIEVTGISVTPNSISLSVGGKKTIEVYITPSNATNKNVTWNSSNPTVATISNGVVIGKSRGNTVITVKTANGKTATTYVEVK